MAYGSNATVSFYDLEALIKAIENRDQAALDDILANLKVDFEAALVA